MTLDQLVERISERTTRLIGAELARGGVELVRVTIQDKTLAILLRSTPDDFASFGVAMRREIHDTVAALTGCTIEGFLFDEVAGEDLILCVFVLSAEPVDPA